MSETVPVKRLVVPIDFSASSRSAFQYAVGLSAVYSAPITLVHVVQLPTLPPTYEIDFSETDVDDVKKRVRTELRRWRRSVDVEEDVSYVIKTGSPASTLLGVASNPEDLLVMATQGLSGLKRAMLGSVAEDILRRAEGPVVSGRSFPDLTNTDLQQLQGP